MPTRSENIQRQYYARTAPAYDDMHVAANDEHFVALRYIAGLGALWGIDTVLDVGCGTGRAVRFLLDQGLDVAGIEPVQDLLDQAVLKHGLPPERLHHGQGEHLPFADSSFDAVCEFAVLHHVADPDRVLSEMMRVTRKAIFLSDGNRFGQGRWLARWMKLALYKTHLWPLANLIKTRGKGYTLSDGDGLAYSYSIYDSFDRLAQWADRLIVIPTRKEPAPSWNHPLLTCSTALLCAIKED